MQVESNTLFEIRFPLPKTESTYRSKKNSKSKQWTKLRNRLKELENINLQKPMTSEPSREVPSHGLGLYLANLAASIVGWHLSVEFNENDSLLIFCFSKR